MRAWTNWVRFWRFRFLRTLAGLSRARSGASLLKENPRRVIARCVARLASTSTAAARIMGKRQAHGHQEEQIAQGRRRQLHMEAASENHARGLDQFREPARPIVREQHDEDKELEAGDEFFADGELALLA